MPPTTLDAMTRSGTMPCSTQSNSTLGQPKPPGTSDPAPRLCGSGVWVAIQRLPTTDGPVGRACPVGLQPTDLIRGRPRLHKDQLRRRRRRGCAGQARARGHLGCGSSDTLTLWRNLNRTAVIRRGRRWLAAQNRSFKSVFTVIRVASTVPSTWKEGFPARS